MRHPIRDRKGLARHRVQNGARWLDESFPGWEGRIDPRTLDLKSDSSCICGQVFSGKGHRSGYYHARESLFTEAGGWITGIVKMRADGEDGQPLFGPEIAERSKRVAMALGFHAGPLVSWNGLQREWQRFLKQRLAENAFNAPDEIEVPEAPTPRAELPVHVDVVDAAEKIIQTVSS